MTIMRSFREYKKSYKNYLSVILYVYLRKEIINVIFKDGHREMLNIEYVTLLAHLINRGPIWKNFLDFINKQRLEIKPKSIKSHEIIKLFVENEFGVKLDTREGVGDWVAVYLDEQYKWLNPDNHIVVDIGGEVGDSAIYFALKGAKKVIVVEPFPNNFQYIKKNIENNGFFGKILPINAMIGGTIKATHINIPDQFIVKDAEESTEGFEINMITLSKIIDDYKIDDALLKMDCEGCEYDSILNEPRETLRKFKRILIEYHYGYKKLKKHLEMVGFNVKYTKPKKGYNRDAENPKLKIGYIFAEYSK